MTAALLFYILVTAIIIIVTDNRKPPPVRAVPDKPTDVFHAIADPNRRRLLELLRDEERCVQDLVPHLRITFGAVSQHLKVLLDGGLVTRRKAGRHRYYRAVPGALDEVHDWVGHYRAFWQERLDRLGRYLDEAD